MNKLDMKSENIVDDNIEYIREKFPNVVVESEKGYAIDFNALKQELSDVIVDETKEKYQLTWPGKKEAIVTANTPTTKTLRPVREKSVNFDTTENIYIEGDNLEALKILQESYLGKIKCIYIDPPYNTGNDFIYNDNFNKDSNQELLDSGQIDEEGNRLVANNQSNGKFHSNWLSMMYPRLKLARNLLTDDGIIFISIDDNEVDNLKKICNEIFGEKNFVNCIALEITPSSGVKRAHKDKMYIKNKEYLMVYKKGYNIKIKPLYDEWDAFDKHYSIYFDGKIYTSLSTKIENIDKSYKNIPMDKYMYFDSIKKFIISNANKIFRTHEPSKWALNNLCDEYIVYNKEKKIYKVPNPNDSTAYELIMEINKGKGYNRMEPLSWNLIDDKIQTLRGDLWLNFDKDMGNVSYEGEIPYPNGKKPLRLISDIIKSVTQESDIVMDFFSGSATTAHACLSINATYGSNRKYVLVQVPEKIDYNKDENKNYLKYNFETICDLGEERIRRAGNKIKEVTDAGIDYGFRVFKIDSSNMKDVYYKPGELSQEQLELFETNIKADRTSEDLLTQVILDLGLTLDLKIEEKNILGNKVYFVDENSLVACFDDDLNINIIDEICKYKPLKVVFKDNSFENDNDKINVEEKIKKLSPETELNIL